MVEDVRAGTHKLVQQLQPHESRRARCFGSCDNLSKAAPVSAKEVLRPPGACVGRGTRWQGYEAPDSSQACHVIGCQIVAWRVSVVRQPTDVADALQGRVIVQQPGRSSDSIHAQYAGRLTAQSILYAHAIRQSNV